MVRAEVSSRRVRAATGDGPVRLELGAVPDRVDTSSGDGSVSVTLPHAAHRVTANSGDGSVNVSVPRDDSGSHVVSATTGDGRITVRTADRPARVFVVHGWDNGSTDGGSQHGRGM